MNKDLIETTSFLPLQDEGAVTLTYTGETCKLPVLSGSNGNNVIYIQNLSPTLNLFTFDPGLGMTACCQSKISFIDGKKGV
ncbi:Citrate synthase [Commensalibacter sp. Nvir]|nr:Citrate synthase [Commensalibacter sp. Nvir]